jgi:hypothetical protein
MSLDHEFSITSDKEETKQKIIKYIRDNDISLPMKVISEEKMLSSFQELKMVDTSKLWKSEKFYLKYNYKYSNPLGYFNSSNIGNVSSNYFFQELRMKCNSITSPSPYRVWNNDKFMNTLLNALFSLKIKNADVKTIFSLIGVRKYIATQFKPIIAKAIFEKFNSKNVLDFSSGWGDRLSGFCASSTTKSYIGIDPNNDLHSLYLQQQKSYNTDKQIKTICSPSEDYEFIDKVDTIFTSPPYFDLERYTYDDKQSWVRYKKLNDWNEKFLFKTLKKAWNVLEPNGVLLLNISDVYTHHVINKICDPMNDFIKTLPNAKYEGYIGMKMSKRPNQKTHKKGVFCEPIWVWSKRE